MRIKFLGKFNNTAKRALSAVLCFAIVFGSFAMVFADTASIQYVGYKWTRVKSRDELEKIYYQKDQNSTRYSLVPKNGNVRSAYGGATNDDTQEHWFRVMLVYNDNCFVSGADMVDDGHAYSGKRMMPTYGIPMSNGKFSFPETFETRSGLGTPYIKYAGWDSEYSDDQFYIRFANSADTAIGSEVLCFNASWYGIQYAAAIKGWMRKTSASSPSSTRASWACSATVHPGVCFRWHGDQVELIYGLKGCVDRSWNASGTKIETAKYSHTNFAVYIGEPTPAKLWPNDQLLDPGTTTTFNSNTLTSGGAITIPQNATLVVMGKGINDGKIIVDGGRLIIRGALDTSPSAKVATNPNTGEQIIPGSIEVKNGGILLVEESGVLVTRFKGSGIKLKDSTAVFSGSVVLNGGFEADNSDVRVRAGAAFMIGFKANDMNDSIAFGRSFLFESSGTYLTSLGKGDDGDAWFTLKNNSSFYCDGLAYDYTLGSHYSVDSTSYIDAAFTTNLNSSIGTSIRKW